MKHSHFIILLFFTHGVFSQQSPVDIKLNTGMSFPVGKFASKSLDGGSFAMPGWTIDMAGSYTFYKTLGVGIQAGYFAHPVDVGSLAYEKVKSDPFLEELVIRSDPYRVITLAGFVQLSAKIAKQLSVTPFAGAGAALGLSPYQLNKPVYFLGIDDWSEKTSTRDWGTYLLAGGQFKYRANDCIAINLAGDIGYTKLVYRFLTGGGNIRDDVHHFLVINVTAGISVTF